YAERLPSFAFARAFARVAERPQSLQYSRFCRISGINGREQVATDCSTRARQSDKRCHGERSVSVEEVEQWSQWALAQADRIDPAAGGSFHKVTQDEEPG